MIYLLKKWMKMKDNSRIPSRPHRKPVYVNPKQLQLLQSYQRIKVFLAGRGGGKTTVAGFFIRQVLTVLARAKFFMLGLTYNQIQSIFLPPMLAALETCGIFEYVSDSEPGHYVVGRKPPAHWASPYQKVKNYDNVITFFNGFTIVMLSFDRSDRNRGGNYDGGILDEAVLINKERFDKEIRTMVRGNIYKFPDNHWHHNILILSSQSWTSSGDWVPDMEVAAAENPDDMFYIEGTAYDNIDALGPRYIKDLQRDLPLTIFQVEVLNQRRKKLPNTFYDEFADDRHCYFNTFLYSPDQSGRLVTASDSTDYNPDLPLEVSFDFNAAFNSCIIGQEHQKGLEREARIINNFFVKNKTFNYLVDDVINYYTGHKNKVLIWGDRNGNNKSADSEQTYYERIQKQFRDAGFITELMVKDRLDPFHAMKHHVINSLLAEKESILPKIRVNQNKCKALITSIQSAPVMGDFKKDKSSERDTKLPQEKATHLSDAFDNWIYPKYHHLIEGRTYTYSTRVV